jgi:hypothetical protein
MARVLLSMEIMVRIRRSFVISYEEHHSRSMEKQGLGKEKAPLRI